MLSENINSTVLVSAVASFIFGAIWFTALFGKKWAELMDFNPAHDEEWKKVGMLKPLLANFISNVLVASIIYCMWTNIQVFSYAGFLKVLFVTWLGFSFPIYANAAIWERKRWSLVLINSVYSLLSLTIISAVIYYM